MDKEFFSASAILLLFTIVYIAPFFVFQLPYSVKLMMVVISIIALVPLSHSAYDWLMSYARNIFYRGEISLPMVTDEEVSLALRNVNKLEKLESSPLLRLKVVRVGGDSLDTLRNLISEAIEYFKPKEEKRNRVNLKYQILRLISDQVEEGQILWGLGFEEYPLEIAEKADGKKPRFAVEYPTDYQAISRNAFISLKKEAIHDLAWRISYLEKHSKK